MKPDYEKSAAKAAETLNIFGIESLPVDPLAVLNTFTNVRVFQFGISPTGETLDALSCVRKKGDFLQYIVLYNERLAPYLINKALARELAHVVLEHDGTEPEKIWKEESNCFAYHFLYPYSIICKKNKKVHYKPIRSSLLWELKEISTFDSIESLKMHIAEERNKFYRFIGKETKYSPEDIELSERMEYNRITGWRNCRDIILDGITVGYCGE